MKDRVALGEGRCQKRNRLMSWATRTARDADWLYRLPSPPLTDSFLRRAGISAGMRVLELGCGVGDVSFIAAGLVGPHGRVPCLDVDPAALEIAESRRRAAGHDHAV